LDFFSLFTHFDHIDHELTRFFDDMQHYEIDDDYSDLRKHKVSGWARFLPRFRVPLFSLSSPARRIKTIYFACSRSVIFLLPKLKPVDVRSQICPMELPVWRFFGNLV
jgi:hypothetical protein